MFGGGFFSTMLKHSKMDHAKQNMDQAKYDLRNFSRELNDVNMACDLHIDTGDFLSFADYFFDGFVVDWMVQDRINTAKRQVEEAIRRTESIVNQLQPLCRGTYLSDSTSCSVHDCRTENLHERQNIHNVNRRKAENKKVICF